MNARINTPRIIAHYYWASSTLVSPRFSIYDADETLLSSVECTQSLLYPNLYISSEAVTFDKTGSYTARLEHKPVSTYVTLSTQPIEVGLDPVSDLRISGTNGVAVVLDAYIVGDITSTVNATLWYEDDSVVETVSAPYSADHSGYLAEFSALTDEGLYYILWEDDGTVTVVQPRMVFIPRTYESVTIELFKTEGSAAVPHVDTIIVLSDPNTGERVIQDITNSSGYVKLVVSPGDYVISFVKDGVLFSRNNIALNIVDTELTDGVNDFRIEADSFSPTLEASIQPVATATIYAQLVDFEGLPVKDTEIKISLHQGPTNFSGNAILGTYKTFKTNKNGYVEFTLVQGVEVTVSIMDYSIRKTFVVPSGDDALSPVNLLELMDTTEDVFDILVVDIPAAPRRSL